MIVHVSPRGKYLPVYLGANHRLLIYRPWIRSIIVLAHSLLAVHLTTTRRCATVRHARELTKLAAPRCRLVGGGLYEHYKL